MSERTPKQARQELMMIRVDETGGTGKNKSKGHRAVKKPGAAARRFNRKNPR